MTAAKVVDVISRLPGCAGQASDAVWAYTPVKMEDAPQLRRLPALGCPTIWIHLPRSRYPKMVGQKIQDPVVPLERNLYGHPWTGLLWERDFEKVSSMGMFIRAPRKRLLSLAVNVDDIKMGGKKNNMKPTWDNVMKQVDLEEPTFLFDQVYLGCTQHGCKPNLKIVQENKDLLESLISAGTIKHMLVRRLLEEVLVTSVIRCCVLVENVPIILKQDFVK